jgi:hypothetical protein
LFALGQGAPEAVIAESIVAKVALDEPNLVTQVTIHRLKRITVT